MKQHFLSGVALAALVAASPAIAADMPVKAPVVAAYDWTGWYAGGNVGYSWGRASSEASFLDLFGGSHLLSNSLLPEGLIGGAQLGYNWQYDNRWVFGLEADFQGSAERDRSSIGYVDFEGGIYTQAVDAKILWFGTVRGRAGVLLNPTIMLYGTGGLAYGKTSFALTVTDAGGGVSAVGDSKTKLGWTLGAGIEGAIATSRDWTWKLEYLYIDLGSLSGAGSDINGNPYSWNAKFSDNILRIGVNYRFH
jgi:outer membrane immunogenic protein